MKSLHIGKLSIYFEWEDAEWKRLARSGESQYISAVKACRASRGEPLLGLREAKDMVDAYLLKRGIRSEDGKWR